MFFFFCNRIVFILLVLLRPLLLIFLKDIDSVSGSETKKRKSLCMMQTFIAYTCKYMLLSFSLESRDLAYGQKQGMIEPYVRNSICMTAC